MLDGQLSSAVQKMTNFIAGTTLTRLVQSLAKVSFRFWLLAAFLLLAFLTGGGSRIDIQSLAILRPVSVLLCAVALMTLRREHFEGRRWLFAGAISTMILLILHVIPLPPYVWQTLPGRQELAQIDAMVGLGDIARPLTITPMNGWHAITSLFAPLAVLLIGIQLNRDDLYRLLSVVIALGALSGLIGLLQVIGSADGPLYFYRITNNGSAVGLFANRNHAAVLLASLFPMLAVFAAMGSGSGDVHNSRKLVAGAIAIILVPLILVTGSRSGLFASVIGLGAAALLYRSPAHEKKLRLSGKGKKIGIAPVLGGLAVLCLVFLTLFFSRAEAINRIFSENSGEDNRSDVWAVGIDIFWKYFPWGSGSGSFVEAFQIVEPNRLLDPTYLNHAHNDLIETAITLGVPGLIVLAVALLGYCRKSYGWWLRGKDSSRNTAFGRLSSVVIAIIFLASLADYPLRTPSMMCLFALLLLWFTERPYYKSSTDAPSPALGEC